jgi:hypothetical protein
MPDSETESEARMENALRKFEADAAKQLAAHEKLIRELEFYKGLLASILRWLGLGSFGAIIAAIFALPPWFQARVDQFQAHVDQQIANRVEEWNALEQGVVLANQGRWSEALPLLMDVYRRQVKGEPGKSIQVNELPKQYRSLLFNVLLFVLASTGDLDPGGQRWLGEQDWNDLSKDNSFRNEFNSRHDETYCNQMFFCTLKFSNESDSLERLVNYQKEANKNAASEQSHAPHLFELAMTQLIAGHTDVAKDRLSEAKKWDEANFGEENVIKYLNGYKNQPEFQMWTVYARRMNSRFGPAFHDFAAQFDQLINVQIQIPKEVNAKK